MISTRRVVEGMSGMRKFELCIIAAEPHEIHSLLSKEGVVRPDYKGAPNVSARLLFFVVGTAWQHHFAGQNIKHTYLNTDT